LTFANLEERPRQAEWKELFFLQKEKWEGEAEVGGIHPDKGDEVPARLEWEVYNAFVRQSTFKWPIVPQLFLAI